MLVGYSSSSEEESEAATATNESCPPKGQEEDDANDGCPARKKPKTKEQVPKTRSVCVWSFLVAFCRLSRQVGKTQKTPFPIN